MSESNTPTTGAAPVADADVEEPGSTVDPALVAVVREIEEHAAGEGWDREARLFALVPTGDLLAREPRLAEAMGIEESDADGTLTPVEQELPAGDEPVESVLEQIMWPDEVTGCAVVVERLVLPPSADGELPDEISAAHEYAADHPDREEVRIVAAAMRSGETFCALRLRTHDDPFSVVESRDLVPALLQLLTGTFEQ